MTVTHMLDNMAAASQNKTLLDDRVTRGAILRSVEQWLSAQEIIHDTSYAKLRVQLYEHRHFSR